VKTLYVSDMDGTLLDASARLPASAASRLRALLEGGLLFTVATGRSQSSLGELLGGLGMTLPAIAMNGNLLYDVERKRIEELVALTPEQTRGCVEILDAHGLAPVLYTFDERDQSHVYYRTLNGGVYDKHYGKNAREGDPRYRQVPSYELYIATERCFYVATLAWPYDLEAACRELDAAHLPYSMYDDVYTGGRFLECCVRGKGEAARALLGRVGAERLVAFGDGLNDLPLLTAADYAVAPRTACPEVLAIADEIIPSGDECGVIAFLEKDFSPNQT
jgi:hydroxymethylpyrimidine pyrophosphatase-like HAD family hydrolase